MCRLRMVCFFSSHLPKTLSLMYIQCIEKNISSFVPSFRCENSFALPFFLFLSISFSARFMSDFWFLCFLKFFLFFYCHYSNAWILSRSFVSVHRTMRSEKKIVQIYGLQKMLRPKEVTNKTNTHSNKAV